MYVTLSRSQYILHNWQISFRYVIWMSINRLNTDLLTDKNTFLFVIFRYTKALYRLTRYNGTWSQKMHGKSLTSVTALFAEGQIRINTSLKCLNMHPLQCLYKASSLNMLRSTSLKTREYLTTKRLFCVVVSERFRRFLYLRHYNTVRIYAGLT